MATRLRNCDETIARGRLAKAEQFLQAAATVRDFADDEADVGDALVTLCVHAGIATRAGYAAPPVNAEQRKRAWRRAESLVESARSR